MLLAQPEPLPERILTAASEAIIDNAFGQWGSLPAVFSRELREAYAVVLRDPAHAHAICEEYRAAATLDWDHDKADSMDGRRIACPVLALWSAGGPLDSWYAAAGGPAALWQEWSDDVQGCRVNAGHFFPEEIPEHTAEALSRFFAHDPMREIQQPITADRPRAAGC
jgi:haloacetate dehalogenase